MSRPSSTDVVKQLCQEGGTEEHPRLCRVRSRLQGSLPHWCHQDDGLDPIVLLVVQLLVLLGCHRIMKKKNTNKAQSFCSPVHFVEDGDDYFNMIVVSIDVIVLFILCSK
jgi:hypothetical protein